MIIRHAATRLHVLAGGVRRKGESGRKPTAVRRQRHAPGQVSVTRRGYSERDTPHSEARRISLAAHDAKLKELRSEMRARGYLLIDRNDNPFCGHCSEVLFALENATA